jgi:hypothetical protein
VLHEGRAYVCATSKPGCYAVLWVVDTVLLHMSKV